MPPPRGATSHPPKRFGRVQCPSAASLASPRCADMTPVPSLFPPNHRSGRTSMIRPWKGTTRGRAKQTSSRPRTNGESLQPPICSASDASFMRFNANSAHPSMPSIPSRKFPDAPPTIRTSSLPLASLTSAWTRTLRNPQSKAQIVEFLIIGWSSTRGSRRGDRVFACAFDHTGNLDLRLDNTASSAPRTRRFRQACPSMATTTSHAPIQSSTDYTEYSGGLPDHQRPCAQPDFA
jgi:hypothetical protein